MAMSNRANVDEIYLNTNVSGCVIGSKKFASWIEKAIEESNCAPELIKLEVTESCVLKNKAVAAETLAQLRTIGVGVALDDFGTGHSNLAYLGKLPISCIKIDRSFITSRLDNVKDKQVVELIIGFANVLEVDVVAEGIETLADLKNLRELDCLFGQGYWFAKPMPVEAAFEYGRNWKSNSDSCFKRLKVA